MAEKLDFYGENLRVLKAEVTAEVSSVSVARVTDQLQWFIQIQARDVEINAETWSPQIEVCLEDLRIRNWHSLDKLEFTIGKNASGSCYHFLHTDIIEGRVNFIRRTQSTFQVEGHLVTEDGIANFDCPVVFTGVLVRCNEQDSRKTARKTIETQIDLSNLVQQEIVLDRKLGDGSMSGNCQFEPRTGNAAI